MCCIVDEDFYFAQETLGVCHEIEEHLGGIGAVVGVIVRGELLFVEILESTDEDLDITMPQLGTTFHVRETRITSTLTLGLSVVL